MTTLTIACGQCSQPLTVGLGAAHAQTLCPKCESTTQVHSYPALWRAPAAVNAGEAVLIDDDSACFYHADKRASVVCEGCGRFLCGLCDIEYKGAHLCSACIERGAGQAKDDGFRSSYTYFDSIALSVAVLPLLLFYLTIFTAPVALFIAVRYWGQTISAVPRSRWRYIAAIALSVLEIVLWISGLIALIVGFQMQ